MCRAKLQMLRPKGGRHALVWSRLLHDPPLCCLGGEKQKLALARALIREPEVLFLDEPCASLDGRATREIETLLLQARAEGTRIIHGDT